MAVSQYSSVTAAELQAKPSLLTHNKSDTPHANEFSYRVGAVLLDGQFFIASPNVDYILEPMMDAEHVVFMREDLRYGPDDYLQWPQPYHAHHPHHAAILRKPSWKHDPRAILWWTPDNYDPGIQSTSSNSNIAFIEPTHLGQLRNCVSEVRASVSRYTAKHPTPADNNSTELALFLLNLVRHFEVRLTSMPMTHFEARRCISGLQLFTLELEALMAWATDFWPRSCGLLPPAGEVDTTRMGCVTKWAGAVTEMVRAGLPVWFIQEVRILNHVRIDTVCPMTRPEEVIITEKPRRIPYRVIFTGRSDDLQLLQNIHAASRIVLTQATIDVFAWNTTPLSVGTEGSSRRSDSAVGHIRAHEGVQVNQHSFRNATLSQNQRKNIATNQILRPQTDICLPRIHPAWLRALDKVNEAKFPDSLPTDRGHAFPDVDLFFNKVTNSIWKDYVFRLLQLRPSLVYRLTPAAPPTISIPYPLRVWRRVLGISESDIGKVHSATGHSTKAAQLNLEAVNVMEGCLRAMGETEALTNFLRNTHPTWRGAELSTCSPKMLPR
ncbi:hypothetical protein NMY22_g9580 [Coprinellus aureogranulatus]|nr:hypothetical protein NMY22_g9580 [Coprinellus aureogranulatus]